MIWRDYPLKKKLLAIIALASGIGLLLSVALSATIQAARHRDAMVTQLSAIAEVVAVNSASAIQFRDSNAAAETLNGLKKRTDIVAAWIVLPDGKLFASLATDLVLPVTVPTDVQTRVEGGLLTRRMVLVRAIQSRERELAEHRDRLEAQVERPGARVPDRCGASMWAR
jgi:hypothetical protein